MITIPIDPKGVSLYSRSEDGFRVATICSGETYLRMAIQPVTVSYAVSKRRQHASFALPARSLFHRSQVLYYQPGRIISIKPSLLLLPATVVLLVIAFPSSAVACGEAALASSVRPVTLFTVPGSRPLPRAGPDP